MTKDTHGIRGLQRTTIAGSPEYSILMFPQKQLPVGMLAGGADWSSRWQCMLIR